MRRRRRPFFTSRSIDRTTSSLRSYSPPKPCGATAPSGSSWWRRIFVICVRTRLSSGRGDQPESHWPLLAGILDRVVTVDAHLHRTTIKAFFRSSRQSVGDAGHRTVPGRPGMIVVGPDVESGVGGDLGCWEWLTVARTRFGTARSKCTTGRRYCLFREHADCLREGAGCGRGKIDRCDRYSRPVSGRTDHTFVRAGIRSVRSTHSVPHPTNAISLDDIFVAALNKEGGARFSRKAPRESEH